MISIQIAHSPEDIQHVQQLFNAYSEWCIQNFIELGYVELNSPKLQTFNNEELPGTYNDVQSFILLSKWNNQPAGCAFLRKIDDSHAEMKRLYVDSEFRGKQIGLALMEDLMAQAKNLGYRYLRICSHVFMGKAIRLYREYGFYDIPNYEDDGLQAGNVQMEYDLWNFPKETQHNNRTAKTTRI